MQIFEMDFPTNDETRHFNWFGRRTCTNKRRFDCFEKAEIERNNLEWQYPMTQIQSYWCTKHFCWHIAHKKDFISEKKNQMNLDYMYICNTLVG